MKDDVKQKLLELLAKEPPMVLSTAYIYSKNYIDYGEDVTEKWLTATQNASALERAYRKGYHDAMQKQRENELIKEASENFLKAFLSESEDK